MSLVLASGSAIRHAMLDSAGIVHRVAAPQVDESAIKAASDGDDRALASQLAGAKALAISDSLSGNWVIGSDSLASVDGRRFDKPASRSEAEAHLREFSGKLMHLTSAVALAWNGQVQWVHAETARLTLRRFSDEFIHNYLESEWPAVSHCVGVFRLEGPGVQLFERIEGDHFTILGMPLLPLLGALRERGLAPS